MSPQTTDRVLVYHHRANGSPVVKKGIALITRAELDQILVNRKSSSHHNPSHLANYQWDIRC